MENNTFVTTENGTANYDWKAIAKANEESYANQLADSKKASQKQYLTDITTKYTSDAAERSADFQLMLEAVSYIKKDFTRSISLYPNVRKVDEFVDSYRQKYETDTVAMMSLLDALPSIIAKIEMTKEQQQELEALLLDVEKLSKTQEQQLAETFLAMSSDYETFKLAKDYAAATRSIQYYLTKYARFINKPLEGLAQIQDEENEFQRKFVDSYL